MCKILLQAEEKSSRSPWAGEAGVGRLEAGPRREVNSMLFSTKQPAGEFPLDPEIKSLALRGYNGGVLWEPLAGGKPRVVAEKSAGGLSRGSVERILAEIKVVEERQGERLLLRAEGPQGAWGVFSSQVRFTSYAPGE